MYKSRIGRDFVYRRIGIVGGHVADSDWTWRHRNRFRVNRDRRTNGALAKTRGHPDQTKATPAAQYRDFCWQGRRGGRKSGSHTYHCLDQSSYRYIVLTAWIAEEYVHITLAIAIIVVQGYVDCPSTRQLGSVAFSCDEISFQTESFCTTVLYHEGRVSWKVERCPTKSQRTRIILVHRRT